MDAPFVGSSLQGYAPASDYGPLIPTSTISSFSHESSFLASLDHSWGTLSPLASFDSHLPAENLYNESSHAHHPLLDPFISHTPAGRTQYSDLTLRPHVYDGSPPCTLTYTPPPSGQVIQLQCSRPAPDEPLPHASAPPCGMLTADMVYPLSSDAPADIEPPPGGASFHPDSYQHDVYNVMWGKDKQSDTHANFSFSHMEANHKNQLPNHRPINEMPHQFSTLRGAGRSSLPMLDVSKTTPSACRTMRDCIASPVCVQSNIFSPAADSDLAMLSVSAPTMVRTSTSSFCETSMAPSESESLKVLASSTSSIKKGASGRWKSLCNDTSTRVAFMVETTLLNLHDGFMWKKYGEKVIKRNKFTRSYFKCDEIDRCGCEALKRTQKCDDGEHILFTYVGIHNHT